MGRIYYVTFGATPVAVTAAQDLFELDPATDKPVSLHWLKLGQTTELGDTAEEELHLSVIRGHATSGSGGAAGTIQKRDSTDGTVGFAAEVNNTTIASTGTAAILDEDTWNVRVPYQWIWTPETRPLCNAGDGLIVVRLIAAPADSVSMVGTLCVEENPG